MNSEKTPVFISYGRRDAKDLAERLAIDLTAHGFKVWLDTQKIASGTSWRHEIQDGIRAAQIVIAVLSPHAVRVSNDPHNADGHDSVCLNEVGFATSLPRPVVPVMGVSCEPPFDIFHLDYVDLTRWRDSDEQYRAGFERLLQGIENARQGKKAYRSWYHQLQPWDFAAFLHEKRQQFTGRKWLFDELDAWRASAKNERALLITGDPGTGKSAVVAELVHRNPGGQVIAYHCCQSDTPATLEAWRFVRSIAGMIASRLPGYAAQLELPAVQEALAEESCRRDPASALERGVLIPLETLPAPAEGVRYLLVDALDEALGTSDSFTIVQLLQSRIGRLPGWLRIVATTRKEPEVLNRFRGLRAAEIDAQDPRNQKDVESYIRQRLTTPNLAALLAQASYPVADFVQHLMRKSAGNFLYVRQVLDGLENDTYSLAELDILPPGLFGLYDAFFRRKFGDNSVGYANAKQVLEVVVAAREPLTAEQLSSTTGLHARRELPAVLNALASFVPPRTGLDGNKTYAAYHKSLTDWLTSEDLLGTTFSVLPEDGEARLAELCQTEYETGVATMSPYTLRYAVRHFCGADAWDNLERLLTDLLYLERRVASGQALELITDFREAIRALPTDRPQWRILKLLDEALWRDIHFIARHVNDYPQALFQCLWNTCWWYDCPNAAAHYVEPEGGWREPPSWKRPGEKLHRLMEQWRQERELREPGFFWLRSQRPCQTQLGGAQLAVFTDQKVALRCASFSPNGTKIAGSSADNTLRIWDAASAAELAVVPGTADSISHVRWIPDGGRLLVLVGVKQPGSRHRDRVQIWDSATFAVINELKDEIGWINTECWSPDGSQIATASTWHTVTNRRRLAFRQVVQVWDATTGHELMRMHSQSDSIKSLDYSPDGTKLVTGGNCLEIWDVSTRAVLATIPWAEREVDQNSLLYKLGIAAGWTKPLKDRDLNCVRFSPDGKTIASGSDESVQIWDAATGTILAFLRGHEIAGDGKVGVHSVDFSPDGRHIVSCAYDKTIRIWNACSGDEEAVFHGHEDFVADVHYSADGSRIISSGDSIRIWDATRRTSPTASRGPQDIMQVVAFWDRARILTCGGVWDSIQNRDNTVRVWDVLTGIQLAVMRGHDAAVEHSAYSPDGTRIVSASQDDSVRVWDAASGTELAVLRGHEFWVRTASYSPNGSRIVSGSDDHTVRVWDAHGGEELSVLRGHDQAIWILAYSHDGSRIVSGSGDKTARIWDAHSYDTLAVLPGHDDLVSSVAYFPDGTRIVSCSVGVARIWDAETFECVETFQCSMDADLIARGVRGLPYRAVVRGRETALEVDAFGRPVAWFPAELALISVSPGHSHPVLVGAGNGASNLYLLYLEGSR